MGREEHVDPSKPYSRYPEGDSQLVDTPPSSGGFSTQQLLAERYVLARGLRESLAPARPLVEISEPAIYDEEPLWRDETSK